ncbi:MAG TPA: hypothetical protein VHN80_25410, partial [Kineosporiaceae bacterium]|nr:hypothetical protein [Kineosporiaceae bacterium]
MHGRLVGRSTLAPLVVALLMGTMLVSCVGVSTPTTVTLGSPSMLVASALPIPRASAQPSVVSPTETPLDSGVAARPSPTSLATASPVPGASPLATASALPGASPLATASALPGAS